MNTTSTTLLQGLLESGDCAKVNNLADTSDQCLFVQLANGCQSESGYIDYMHFIYCEFLNRHVRAVGFLLLAFWLIYLLLALSVASGKFFAPNLPVIADALHMSENVAGETLMALGNGAPDIFTSLAAALKIGNSGDVGLLYGELLGAGMLVTTVIVGVIISIRPFKTMERPLLRDLIFYMFAIYTAFFTLWDGIITLIEASAFLIIYGVYLVTVLSSSYLAPKFDAVMEKYSCVTAGSVSEKGVVGTKLRQQQKLRNDSVAETNEAVLQLELDPKGDNNKSKVPKIKEPASLKLSDSDALEDDCGSHREITIATSIFNGETTAITVTTCDNNNSNEHNPAPSPIREESNDDAIVPVAGNNSSRTEGGVNKTTVLIQSATKATTNSPLGTPGISVTKSSGTVTRSRLQANLTATTSNSSRSQSMKLQRLSVVPSDVSLLRQFSLIDRRKATNPAAAKGDHPSAEKKDSIPHAARIMIRSASNKEKSAAKSNNSGGENKGKLLERSNTIAVKRQPSSQQQMDVATACNRRSQSPASKEIHSKSIGKENNATSKVQLPTIIVRTESINNGDVNSGKGDAASAARNEHLDSSSPSVVSEVKALWRWLFDGLNPINVPKLREQHWHRKVVHILRAPALFCMLLTNPVVNEDKAMSNWNRPINMMHCIVAPIFVTFTFSRSQTFIGGVPLPFFVGFIGTIVAIAVGFTSANCQRPKYHVAFAFIGVVTTVSWINLLATEIVNVLHCIGDSLNISSGFLGLTCLAWGNSLGDLLNDATIARQGYPKMAISACFGGMLFNLLLGLGIPLTITVVKSSSIVYVTPSNIITVLFGFLSINIVTSFVVLPLVLKFYVKRPFAVYLFTLYGCFIVTVILTEAGIIRPNIFPKGSSKR